MLNWNSSFNGSYIGRRHNISHFIEFQASVMIWRYVAPVILVVGEWLIVLWLLYVAPVILVVGEWCILLCILHVAPVIHVVGEWLIVLWLLYNIYIRLMSRAACKTHNFFVYVSLDISVWILVAVSVDRCLYVSWPQLARKWCKLRNARITVATIVVLSALINVHFFWTYDLETADSQHIYANGNKKCYADTSSELAVSFVENVWPWIDFCVYCLFPFMFMATANSIIIKQLVRTEKNMASYLNTNLDGVQRSATELRQASQVSMSNFTSPGRNSNAAIEEKTNERGKGNKSVNDISQLGITERIIKCCGDPFTVQVVYSSETEGKRTLSMDVGLSNERKSKSLTTDKQCVNKSQHHNKNIGTNVSNKLLLRTSNTAEDINQSCHHNVSNGVGVKKSHFHNENVETDVKNKLFCRSRNTGVGINQSQNHNGNNGTQINKLRYLNENIGTVVDKKPLCHDSIRSGTHQGVQQTLGLPHTLLSSSQNKWQNTSTASDMLTPALSRRNTRSVSKTLLAVTIVFWILNAPIVIFIIGQTYIITSADDRGRAVVILAWTIVNILQYINGALHFFLYCLTSPKFRQELKDMFKECSEKMKRTVP
ncbi:unnamed protein product [Candidula unifasciata]|uniref:G-protein coupled receptors family 1 profile domain-containing protein n=1 Tax=Candidula unifasciata TaxID=100452 RepID=A0A8S3YUY1_9EUPU|nr:unnamed protein product [Candidula unifasciata]